MIVLVIDDSKADRMIAMRAIRKFDRNITVLEAVDGLSGLEILKNSKDSIDLILLDINMPRMNGHEFIEAYDVDNDLEAKPVVVMLTSSDQARDKERTLKFDFVKEYVLKPLELADMKSLVERLL